MKDAYNLGFMCLSSEPEGIEKNICKHSWRLDIYEHQTTLFMFQLFM